MTILQILGLTALVTLAIFAAGYVVLRYGFPDLGESRINLDDQMLIDEQEKEQEDARNRN
jgi:hypothetical protein